MKELNDSVNLLALAMIICAGWFVHMGQPQIAHDLIIGAIGIISGKAISHPPAPGGPSGSAGA